MNDEPVDGLVIGAGNAAANAAHEAGASVAMIETASQDARAGNSAFTGGAPCPGYPVSGVAGS